MPRLDSIFRVDYDPHCGAFKRTVFTHPGDVPYLRYERRPVLPEEANDTYECREIGSYIAGRRPYPPGPEKIMCVAENCTGLGFPNTEWRLHTDHLPEEDVDAA